MKLIGIDSIFIPQNWLNENNNEDNIDNKLKVLVPQFES
jgi:hypothetical protein